MVTALFSRSEGSITAQDIRTRTALLPDTHRTPRPRMVESDYFEGPLIWQRAAGGFQSWVTVGNVAAYWEGADEQNKLRAYYYTQHNAAAQIQLVGVWQNATLRCAWQLVGQFGGIQSPLDTQPFVPTPPQGTPPWNEQPLVASRSWVMPELIAGRAWVWYETQSLIPPEITIRLQWSLILTNPVT